MNERDSEIISQSLSHHDYLETTDIDSANLIILNTCSIRAKAEQKVFSMLGYLRKYKEKNPDLKICVAGCVAQQEGDAIIERMPHVNLVVGTQHIYQIPELLRQAETKSKVSIALSDDYKIPRFIPETASAAIKEESDQPITGQFSRFVNIMQGCNNYCAYCVVPYTRGREVSRNISDIIDEIEKLVQDGVQEITLLGQNVNSYGRTNQVTDDGSPCSFPELLHKVSKVENLKRLRFTTSNPKDLSLNLMKCFRDIDILCPQFHLPVQSGSNATLKRMNRKYTREKYYRLIDSLKSYCPDIVITTDIIVGFPGETEEDFQKTMELLETVRFDGSFSFKYSDRPGTPSTKFSDKISEEEKSRRLLVFQNRQKEIGLEKNKNHIDKYFDVMVEGLNGDKYQCRAKTNHIVHVKKSTTLSAGDIIKVRITQAGHHSLQGILSCKN